MDYACYQLWFCMPLSFALWLQTSCYGLCLLSAMVLYATFICIMVANIMLWIMLVISYGFVCHFHLHYGCKHHAMDYACYQLWFCMPLSFALWLQTSCYGLCLLSA